MPTQKLMTVNESETDDFTVASCEDLADQPCLEGGGEWDLICGGCDNTIGRRVSVVLAFVSEKDKPVFIRGNVCGSYNTSTYVIEQSELNP